MPLWIALLNSITALASTGFGIAALIRPALLAPAREIQASSRFYSFMYAGRAIPLGIAVGIAVWIAPPTPILAILVGVALLAQITDLSLGIINRLPGMIAGALFAAAWHGAALMTII